MKTLTTGQDSTLGNYRKLTASVLGDDSPATKHLDNKILESPGGENEEVLADEGQMLNLLLSLHAAKEGR
jgi:hypothetical protein